MEAFGSAGLERHSPDLGKRRLHCLWLALCSPTKELQMQRGVSKHLDIRDPQVYWDKLCDAVSSQQMERVDSTLGKGLNIETLKDAIRLLQSEHDKHSSMLNEHSHVKRSLLSALARKVSGFVYEKMVTAPIEFSEEVPAELPANMIGMDLNRAPKLFHRKKESVVHGRNQELEVKKSVFLDIKDKVEGVNPLVGSVEYSTGVFEANRVDIDEARAIESALPLELYCLKFPRNVQLEGWNRALHEYMALQELVLSPYFPDVCGSFDKIDSKLIVVAAQSTESMEDYIHGLTSDGRFSEASPAIQGIFRECLKALASIECMSTFDITRPLTASNFRVVEPTSDELNILVSSVDWGAEISSSDMSMWKRRHCLLALSFLDLLCFVVGSCHSRKEHEHREDPIVTIKPGVSSSDCSIDIECQAPRHITLPSQTEDGRPIQWSQDSIKVLQHNPISCQFSGPSEIRLEARQEGSNVLSVVGHIDDSDEFELLISTTIHRNKLSPFLLTVINMYCSAYWETFTSHRTRLHNLDRFVMDTKVAPSEIDSEFQAPSLMSLACHPYFS